MSEPFQQGRQVSIDHLQQILGNEPYRLTPATLAVQMTHGKYLAPKHIQFLSMRIAYELNKGNARLIISMPPRHGKSKLGSVRTPVWQFDRFPERQIGITSYGADLASEFSEEVRDIIMADQNPEEGEHLLRVSLNTTKVNNWTTSEKGRMYAVGVGGSLYGRGVHDLLVDDYYKNVEEAESESYRNKVYEWFAVIASTRVEPGGNIIIIATRWHHDDLSGRLLAMPDSAWKEIKIPGLAEENDPLGRKVGEALWPGRYDEAALQGWKSTMGGYFFDAIVQQKPRKSRSNLFQESWVPTIDALPTEVVNNIKDWQLLRWYDLAGTEEGGDFTCGTHFLYNKKTGKVYIIDVKCEQLSPGRVEQLVLLTADEDGPETEIGMFQDPGSSGKTVAENYRTLLTKKGYKFWCQTDTGSKFIRAIPFFAACESGRVTLIRGSWNPKWYDEMSRFPEGNFDDRVDSAAGGFNRIFKPKRKAGTFGRLITPNYEKTASGLIVPAHVIAATKPKHSGVFRATWGRKS